MGYRKDETDLYNTMLNSFVIFKELKKRLSQHKCTVHGKKIKMEVEWENDYEVNIYISKYCCAEFAKEMAVHFDGNHDFNSVVIAKE